jgi:hypothetical protein
LDSVIFNLVAGGEIKDPKTFENNVVWKGEEGLVVDLSTLRQA